MKFALILLLLLSLTFNLRSQTADIPRIYSWEEVKHASPDTIYGVTLSRMKFAKIPSDLKRFTNLTYLDLSKNKLSELPEFVGDFNNLTYLDISKNEFTVFPVEICRLVNLNALVANRNEFDRLPECIGFLKHIEILDLWETPVMTFPEGLLQMKSLKKLDLQGVKYGPTFQKQFKEKLFWVEILFDPPCDCME